MLHIRAAQAILLLEKYLQVQEIDLSLAAQFSLCCSIQPDIEVAEPVILFPALLL